MINKSFLLILISGVFGGSVYPLIKIAETYNIPKFSYIFWESFTIVFIVLLLALIKRERQLFNRKAIKYYSFCAITNILISQTLFFIIAPNLPSNIISIIVVLTPLFVYMSSILFLKTPLQRTKLLGVIIGLTGIFILFAPNLLQDSNNISWHWLALSLLIPIDYTINRIYASKHLPINDSPHSLVIGLFSIVTIISFLLMGVTGQFYIPWKEWSYGDLALLTHAVFMSLFYLIFFVLAKKCSLQNSLSFYVAPLVGISWGFLYFQEAFSLIFTLSSALVFWGLYLVIKK